MICLKCLEKMPTQQLVFIIVHNAEGPHKIQSAVRYKCEKCNNAVLAGFQECYTNSEATATQFADELAKTKGRRVFHAYSETGEDDSFIVNRT
jgi:hypothetical protein